MSRLPVVFALAAAIAVTPGSPPAAFATSMVHEGMTHESLGGATLGLDPLGRLLVSNIGPSGDDGVITRVPRGAGGMLFCWALDPNGAMARWTATGWDGFFDIEYGFLTIDDSDFDGRLDVTAEFPDAPMMYVTVLDGTNVVGQVAVPSGTGVFLEPLGPWGSLRWGAFRSGSSGETTHAFQLDFDQPVRCVVTGAAQMDGRSLFVHCCQGRHMKTASFLALNGKSGGGNDGGIAISQEGVKAFEADARALGAAAFDVDGVDPVLAVTGISSTGLDGVAFGPGLGRSDLSEMRLEITRPVPVDLPPAMLDAFLVIEGIGTVSGTPDQSLGGLTITLVGQDFEVEPHFNSFDNLHHHYQVLDHGALVADLHDQTGAIVWGMGAHSGLATTIGPSGKPRYHVYCRSEPCPTFTIGGIPYAGDEVMVEPENMPPGTTVEGIHELRARASDLTELRFWDIEYLTLTPTLDAPGPRAPGPGLVLRRVWPNPAAGAVEVELALATRAAVQAEIVDLAGRRVCRLASSTLEAGPQRLRWDGRDGAGAPAANGIYFVRVTGGGLARSARFALAR